MNKMQESILAQYAKSATLFGIQFLYEVKKTHPEWLGEQFEIPEEVANLIEEKCMKFLGEESKNEDFTTAVSSTEFLYNELVCVGRSVTMDLIDPYMVNKGPRLKVVENILVMI